MTEYIALLHKDEDSDYGVSFPDFPGCITAGSTMEEARKMAQEALAAHLQFMLEEGDKIPEPSSLERIAHNPEYEGAAIFVVTAPIKTKRINITMHESTLREIDKYVREHSLSRSAFLADAAMHRIRQNCTQS
ncbi:MAG: type II toxin-antitoxin system HicB family antitoxin [Pseudomonadota bacterium]